MTAGIDLALALVEEDLGRAVALEVARYLVVFLKRPGGQAQFSATLSLQAADDRFGALHEWINEHLSADLSLALLADRAGMSERSFSRHYAQATGITPVRGIERLRVQAARRLLSESGLPMKRIASRCGFVEPDQSSGHRYDGGVTELNEPLARRPRAWTGNQGCRRQLCRLDRDAGLM